MKDLLKMVKKHILITSIAGIILGLVLVCVPGVISDALCYVLAGACMLYGIFSLVSYFRQRIESQSGFEFVFGVIAIVAGIFVCVNVAFIKGIISWILSIAVIIVGTFRLQQAIDLARMHDRFQWAAFVMAGITLVLGILSAILMVTTDVVIVIIGFGFICCGITGIVLSYRISKGLQQMSKQQKYIYVESQDSEKE